jgi:hypothetical protein
MREREWRWAGAAELGQKRELGRRVGRWVGFGFFSNPFQIFLKPFLNSNL